MDPEETLRLMRRLCHEIERRGGNARRAEELAELVRSMDQWLSKGGFKPVDWKG